LEENFRFRLLVRCGTNGGGGGECYVWSACCSHNRIWNVFTNGFFKSLVKKKFMFGQHVTCDGGDTSMCGVCVVVQREFGICVLTVAFELTKLGSLNHNVCLFLFSYTIQKCQFT
jgi:hypothetical protein